MYHLLKYRSQSFLHTLWGLWMTSSQHENYGCSACWSDDLEHTWKALVDLTVDTHLVDESHLMVKIRSCSSCHQKFVSVFAEKIDWDDGDDPQFWCLCPLAEGEVNLLKEGEAFLLRQLRKLAPKRRSLCHDAPKGGPARLYWAQGVIIGDYD